MGWELAVACGLASSLFVCHPSETTFPPITKVDGRKSWIVQRHGPASPLLLIMEIPIWLHINGACIEGCIANTVSAIRNRKAERVLKELRYPEGALTVRQNGVQARESLGSAERRSTFLSNLCHVNISTISLFCLPNRCADCCKNDSGKCFQILSFRCSRTQRNSIARVGFTKH